jgi:hypothetical protein
MLLNNSGVNNDFRLGSSTSAFRVVNSTNTIGLFSVQNSGEATFSSSVTSTGLIVNGTEFYYAPANYASGGFTRLLGRNASTGRIEGMSASDIQAFIGLSSYVSGSGTTNYLPKFTGTSTIGNSIVFDNGSSVGINTITPSLQGFNNELTISSGTSGTRRTALNLQGSRTSASTFASIGFYHQANFVASIESSRGGADNTGNLQFFTTNAGVTGERLTITSAGAATFSSSLQVNGGSRLVGSATVGGDTTQWVLAGVANGGAIFQKSHSGAGGPDDRYLRFGNVDNNGNPNYVISIINSNTGFGTTSPNQRVHIDGQNGQPATSGGTQNGILRIQGGSGVGFGETLDMGFHVGVSGPASYAWLQSTNTGSLGINYRLCLNPNGGNVGVGTNSPSEILHVTSAGGNVVALVSAASGSFAQYHLKGGGTNPWVIGTQDNYVGNGLVFRNVNDRMIIFPDGNIIIGTGGNAGFRLDINGTTRTQGMLTGEGGIKISGSGGAFIGAYTSDGLFGATANPNFISTTGSSNVRFGYMDNGSGLYSTALGYLVKSTDGAGVPNRVVSAFRIRDADKSADTFIIYNNGAVFADGSITSNNDVIAYASSDRNLKDNIVPIKNPLEKISKIGGYSFTWNDNQETYAGEDYGVIAQEIEEILPEIVTTRESGYKAVKYEKIVPLLIEAVKELKAEVNELRSRLDR